MQTLVAVMRSVETASAAVRALVEGGVPVRAIRLVVRSTPAPPDAGPAPARVPTTEAEPPGVAPVIGGVVGAAAGVSLGVAGAAAASMVVPGVGPVLGFASLGAALLGLGGALGGAAAGRALDDTLDDGVPRDEAYVYGDALRQGRVLVVATIEPAQAERARAALREAGAESVDAARAMDVGRRSADEERYPAQDAAA